MSLGRLFLPVQVKLQAPNVIISDLTGEIRARIMTFEEQSLYSLTNAQTTERFPVRVTE